MTASFSSGLFHVGIVVKDLDHAMRKLGSELGVRWTPVTGIDSPVRLEDGNLRQVPLRLAFSLDGPVHVELIEHIVDTVWSPPADDLGRLHHLGYWTDDMVAKGAELERQGARPVTGLAVEGVPMFQYYRSAVGVYIELCNAAARATTEASWAAAGG